jgi:serine phosphatase RsbU (regulator of sigma subunit)
MEKIAEKLSQENSLSAQEKRELEQYLNQLEEQLIETDLAYEDAQVKTKAIIDQMRESLHEKDSLHVAAQETIEVISTEKEEVERQKKRDLMIFTAVALMFATFSGILLVTARRIRRQRNELGVVNAQLSQTKNELEERVQEINRQNNEISRQANHLRKLNKEVSTKNQKLTDNIRYAKTVQEAILPPVNLLHGHFADFFVTYIPKDIVSGDFYWFSVVPGTQGQRVVLAAVDCTGHGVSGAFMSMMGSALLNEIVNQQQITDPATILSELNQGIVSGLRQQETANDDGMDVALCVMDRQPNGQAIALFTGAKRPVMAYHQQTGEVAIYKGDRKSVGGKHQSAEPFSVQQILLEPGDALYLFSDGLTDQNNPERKKFGSERLTQFIKTHARESMASQKQLLESALAQHQESAEQRDDIMLIGLRI